MVFLLSPKRERFCSSAIFVPVCFFFQNQQDKTNAEASKMSIKVEILVFQAALAGACCQFLGRCSYSFRKLTAGNNLMLERYPIIWHLCKCVCNLKSSVMYSSPKAIFHTGNNEDPKYGLVLTSLDAVMLPWDFGQP